MSRLIVSLTSSRRQMRHWSWRFRRSWNTAWCARVPVHDTPLTVALFENCRAEPATIHVTRLAVFQNVSCNCVFESGPGSFAGEMDLKVAEFIFRVFHLCHLRDEMIITIVDPAVVCMTAFKDR